MICMPFATTVGGRVVCSRMMRLLAVALFLLTISAVSSQQASAAPYRVLVVMSYHEEYPWSREIKAGIDTEFSGGAQLRYLYLDMKNNPKGGPTKAKEAFAVYQEWHPDGVIAADDYAQSAFVLPYLKDKVQTPVIFCGVNKEAAEYGYPASNVTGVLERYRIRETFALLKKLVPTVQNACVLLRGNEPTSDGILAQMKSESSGYPVKIKQFRKADTMEDAVKASREFTTQCDALYLEHFEGTPDHAGKPHTNHELIRELAKNFGGPTVCSNFFSVQAGCLAAELDSGKDQGSCAARMMQRVLSGTPLQKIPIARNLTGAKVINLNTMKFLGIDPKPADIRDIKMIKSSE